MMSSHPQIMPQLRTSFNSSRSPDGGNSSSSDTPGGSRNSHYGFNGMSRSRGSVDYSSATDNDIGYSSAASNSTFIPAYHHSHHQGHHLGAHYTSPTIYEQQLPLSPAQQQHHQQQQQQLQAGRAQSTEYTSPGAHSGGGGGAGGTTPSAVANSSAAQYGTRRGPPTTPPVPLACTECRLRHLRCDAGTPTCARCRSEGRTCCYVKSRRGWKGRKRKGSTAVSGAVSATSGTEASANENGVAESGGEGGFSGLPRIPPHYTTPSSKANANANVTEHHTQQSTTPQPYKPVSSVQSNPLETLRAYHKNSTQFQAQHEHVPHAPSANLIQLYYAYFHSSHPFMLPPAYLVKTNVAKLTHLMPVVRYIGSFFAPNAPRDSFRDAAEYTLFRQNAPKNGFTVQAMLLFAIGLHASNEQEKSGQVKDAAVDIALEIGMNREEFSYFGGEPVPDEILMAGDENGGDVGMIDEQILNEIQQKRNTQDQVERVMQESWRRTWWELYFLDGILAGVHQRPEGFRLWLATCTVPLPCEEAEYNNGRIPDPKSLEEFEDRTFADEPVSFSSYAYRVEAIRILGQVLACSIPLAPASPPQPTSPPGGSALAATSNNVQSIPDGRADAADASLVNWALHLPDDKKELVGKDRKVDEMLFQAHMIVYATSIYLHRPRSHLVVSLVSDETSCTPVTGYTVSNHPIIFHTSKAVHAANAISKLVTLPTPLVKHSPFFTCVLTLATVVHLSACSWLLAGDEGFLAKERIRLGIGALKTMEVVWGVAGCVLGQVRGAAREVFRFQKLEGMGGVVGGGWGGDGMGVGVPGMGGLTEEEVLRYLEEEGGLGGDVAGLGEMDPAMRLVGGVGEEGEWEIAGVH